MAGNFTVIEGAGGREDDIASMTRAAFARQYGSGDGEVALIAALRADGDVVVELTALEAGDVVGHILFSKLIVAPDTLRMASLAPVCTRIDRQKSGIGSALIREGLARCKALGFDAVLVQGDPNYYRRFGFSVDAAAAVASEYSGPYFQALALKGGVLKGRWTVQYPKAFAAA